MSGAAAIAAAKNRRGKSDNSTRFPPPTSCSLPNKISPPGPVNTRAMPRAGSVSSASLASASSSAAKEQLAAPLSNLVDPTTLQILGPMPPAQILKYHEQRLNRFDEKMQQFLAQGSQVQGQCSTVQMPISQMQVSQMQGPDVISEVEEECFSRISDLESKLAMLEEVIMNLQNKLTVVQNFTMETNLDVSKLKNLPAPVCTCSHTCSSPVNASETLPISEISNDLPSVLDATDLTEVIDVSDITNVSMSVSEMARL
jgi:hypothetical protein